METPFVLKLMYPNEDIPIVEIPAIFIKRRRLILFCSLRDF